MNLLKWLNIPTGETKAVQALQTWTVTWISRQGSFHGETRKEFEVFINEQTAKDFKKALEDAYKLIRHTSGIQVQLMKN